MRTCPPKSGNDPIIDLVVASNLMSMGMMMLPRPVPALRADRQQRAPPTLLARADEVIEQIILERMPGACSGAESAHGGTIGKYEQALKQSAYRVDRK